MHDLLLSTRLLTSPAADQPYFCSSHCCHVMATTLRVELSQAEALLMALAPTQALSPLGSSHQYSLQCCMPASKLC